MVAVKEIDIPKMDRSIKGTNAEDALQQRHGGCACLISKFPLYHDAAYATSKMKIVNKNSLCIYVKRSRYVRSQQLHS